MIELAALCIVIVVGVPLVIMALGALLVFTYHLAIAAIGIIMAPFMLAWMLLKMLASAVGWCYRKVTQ